ncbi:hypothetical protein EYR36_008798 [Pleurotus pulmonarius]|nr:hypothetical protein EYR36_008798 [Pleurotus pulmonarius]
MADSTRLPVSKFERRDVDVDVESERARCMGLSPVSQRAQLTSHTIKQSRTVSNEPHFERRKQRIDARTHSSSSLRPFEETIVRLDLRVSPVLRGRGVGAGVGDSRLTGTVRRAWCGRRDSQCPPLVRCSWYPALVGLESQSTPNT